MRWRTINRTLFLHIIATWLFLIVQTYGLVNNKNSYPATATEIQELQILDEVKALLKKGSYSKAEQLSRKILVGVEATYGTDSIETAHVIDTLIESIFGLYTQSWDEFTENVEKVNSIEERNALREPFLRKTKELEEEIEVLGNRAIYIRKNVLGTEHPDVVKSLAKLANQLKETRRWRSAKPLLENALVIAEKIYDPNHVDIAEILQELASQYSSEKDYARKKEYLERALRIREQVFGSEHLIVAETLERIGYFLSDAGELAEAKSFLERALVIKERAFDSGHEKILDSLIKKLHSLAYRMDDHAGVIALYEHSLSITEKILGPEHPKVAHYLGLLAEQHLEMANYSIAIPFFERALTINEKNHGVKSMRVANSLNDLAIANQVIGDYDRALMFYERCLAIEEEIYGTENPRLVMVLGNLAGTLENLGDYAGADAALKRALKIWEKYRGPNAPEVFETLQIRARLNNYSGNYNKSMEFYQRALEILEKEDQRNNQIKSINVLRAIAILHQRKGEDHKAIPLIEKALAIKEKWYGPDHFGMTWVLNDFALHLIWDGQMDRALENALRSEEIARNNLCQFSKLSSERQALATAAEKSRSIDICLSLAARSQEGINGAADKVWDTLIRSRALVLDEISARNRIIADIADPEVSVLADFLAKAHENLANLVIRGPNLRNPKENYRDLMDKARNEKEQAERALAEASIAFKEELNQSRAGLPEIKTSLPPDFAIVAFALYNHYEPPDKEKDQGGAKEDSAIGMMHIPFYLAFVLKSQNDEPVVIPLGKAEEIDPLIFDWGQEAARGTRIPGRSMKEAEAAYRAAGDSFRQKVWEPIASHLGETEKVFVILDGALNLVNFAALPTGKDKFLIETGPLMHYLSAERDLITSNEARVIGTGLLALGDPSFDETTLFSALSPDKIPKEGILAKAKSLFRGTRSNCGEFKTLKFTPLPAAQKEIEEITEIWDKSKQSEGDVLKLTGDLASEREFKINASGKLILHLATHGYFLEGSCQSLLSPAENQRNEWEGEGRLPPVTGENPLLLSGLALAGANHRDAAGPEEEDGILTAEEVAALNLSGVKWVVLSACDTGVGKIRAGEGVFGLRRAFQLAGAQTLITSLWAVDDDDARKWMKALYEASFNEGLGTAESIREASLEVLQELRKKKKSTHPFHWAGFVASGDWR